MAQLKKIADASPNGSVQVANAFVNDLKAQIGSSNPTELAQINELVASEMAKVYKGNASPSDSDKEEMRAALNANSFSPEQVKGFLTTAQHAITSRIMAMSESYKQSTGRYPRNAIQPTTVDALRTYADPATLARISKLSGTDAFTPEERKMLSANAELTVYQNGKGETETPTSIANAIKSGMA